jgi:DNA-binding beta-propeller fold protein YncE
MMRRRTTTALIAGALLAGSLLAGHGLIAAGAAARATVNTIVPDAPARPPRFEVDASWPKPLPNGWVMGQAAGVAVDRHDHVWVIQRPKTSATPAPPVLEFSADGTLLSSWGAGAGQAWPGNEHGIHVDHQDGVWIAGNGPRDGQVFKFTRAGRPLLTIGEPGVIGDDADTKHLNRPAAMVVDPGGAEIFVADGYGNHRVIVFDAQTGAYRRHWGANGRPPGTAGVKGFANPVHCIRLARDGLLYVCDRAGNRIQVFRKDGTFVREIAVAPETKGNGSTWDADLSPDPSQSLLHAADGQNQVVWTLLRETGRLLGSFGAPGRAPGEFHWVHNLAVDSRGAIYTTEVDTGKRAQRFVRVER